MVRLLCEPHVKLRSSLQHGWCVVSPGGCGWLHDCFRDIWGLGGPPHDVSNAPKSMQRAFIDEVETK